MDFKSVIEEQLKEIANVNNLTYEEYVAKLNPVFQETVDIGKTYVETMQKAIATKPSFEGFAVIAGMGYAAGDFMLKTQRHTQIGKSLDIAMIAFIEGVKTRIMESADGPAT